MKPEIDPCARSMRICVGGTCCGRAVGSTTVPRTASSPGVGGVGVQDPLKYPPPHARTLFDSAYEGSSDAVAVGILR